MKAESEGSSTEHIAEMAEETPLLAARGVSFAYTRVDVVSDVDVALECGTLRALLGPNGSGKTTLLKLLMGILHPSCGTVEYQGKNLKRFARRKLARQIAFVPQDLEMTFGFTVRQMVTLGRTPHIGAFAGATWRDHEIVDQMMELTETAPLSDRLVTELSGGEKQRVVIAMALAQEPQIILLDEPTVHLDINHQVEILELVRRLNRERGLTVLATMHDLNLAALYFDDLLLLERGHVVAAGAPRAVLSVERIRAVFHAEVQVQPHPTRAEIPQIVALPINR